VIPLLVLLPVLLAVPGISAQGQAAILFFTLAPYILYPILWFVARATHIFPVEAYFTIGEMVFMGGFLGVFLPVVILLPILKEASMAGVVYDVLFACTILVPCSWIPVWLTILQTPPVLETREQPADPFSKGAQIDREMKTACMGIFTALCVPLGLFLPIYLLCDMSEQGEAAIMFFALFFASTSLLWVVLPRFAELLVFLNELDKPNTKAFVVFVGCALFLPVIVFLPIYYETDLLKAPRDVLLAFIIGLPSITILEVIRIKFAEESTKLYFGWSMAFFLLIMPIGVLLPSWLGGDINEAGQIAFLVFMLTPHVVQLIIFAHITLTVKPELPFAPLIHLTIDTEEAFWKECVYMLVCVAFPPLVCLPVFFHGGIAGTAHWVLLGYMSTICLETIILFIASLVKRDGPLPTHVKKSSKFNADKRPRLATLTDVAPFMVEGPAAQLRRSEVDSEAEAEAGAGEQHTHDGLQVPFSSAHLRHGSELSETASIFNEPDALERKQIGKASAGLQHDLPGHFVPRGIMDSMRSISTQDAAPAASGGSDAKLARKETSREGASTADTAKLARKETNRSAPQSAVAGPDPNFRARSASAATQLLISLPEAEEYHTDDPEEEPTLLPHLITPLKEGGWERVKGWEWNASMARMVCTSGDMEVHIDEEEAWVVGRRYAVYSATLRENDVPQVIKCPVRASKRASKDTMQAFYKQRALAGKIVDRFNAAIAKNNPKLKWKAKIAEALCLNAQYRSREGNCWVVAEKDLTSTAHALPGAQESVLNEFIVWNDMEGHIISLRDLGAEDTSKLPWVAEFKELHGLVQALSCFSYFHSNGKFLMANMRGVKSEYTCPDFHFAGEDPFHSPLNKGVAGMDSFFASHIHGDACTHALLSLPNFNAGWLDNNTRVDLEDPDGGYFYTSVAN
jgi:hypothetical protein